MKLFILSILIVLAFGANGSAQESDVQGAIVGNDPAATLTTGIGQVVKPVGAPVIQSPSSALFAPQPQPALSPTTAGTQRTVLSDMTTAAPETGKAKWIRIPESKLPRIQTIPYR
ncbi:MAG: hypothetical protein HY877_06465 [Deltaproteobacteria bacterium]|nr:hypothetical protein [Deltaproteobacteria bacterium]